MVQPPSLDRRYYWIVVGIFVLSGGVASNGCCPIRVFPPQQYKPPGSPEKRDPLPVTAAPLAPAVVPIAAPPPPHETSYSPPASTPEELRSQAQQAWEQRENRAALERAIAAWEQVSGKDPNDAATATALSHAWYFLADGTLRGNDDNEAVLRVYERGLVAGERAMMSYPAFAARVRAGDRVEDALVQIPNSGQAALYWYASNLGRFSLAKGFTTTLFYKERAQAVMQRVLAMDETFYYAAPHRYFGAYYAKAPSFAGGDLGKSREHFERALRINSTFFATKVLYAELYATRADDKALFVRLLSEVRDGDATQLADVAPEQRVEQDKAKKLLAQVDELF